MATDIEHRAWLIAWLLLFTLVGSVAVWLFIPFWPGLVWGAILAVAGYPLFSGVAQHRRPWLAFAVAGGMLIAILGFMGIAAHELITASHFLIPVWKHEAGAAWPVPLLLEHLPIFRPEAIAAWHGATTKVSEHLETWPARIPYILGVLRGASGILVDLLITCLIFFFLLKDGPEAARLLTATRSIHPLLESCLRAGIDTVRAMAWSVVLAMFSEILLFWPLFAVVGLPHPFILGAFCALAAIIPIAGTLAILGLGGYLWMGMHSVWAAIGVVILGSGLLFVADNVAKPFLARWAGSPAVPSAFWLLAGMFCGITVCGVPGIFLGPAIFAMFSMLLRALVSNKVNVTPQVRAEVSRNNYSVQSQGVPS